MTRHGVGLHAPTSVRIPESTKTRARERAEAEGLDLTKAIVRLLELYADGKIDIRKVDAGL